MQGSVGDTRGPFTGSALAVCCNMRRCSLSSGQSPYIMNPDHSAKHAESRVAVAMRLQRRRCAVVMSVQLRMLCAGAGGASHGQATVMGAAAAYRRRTVSAAVNRQQAAGSRWQVACGCAVPDGPSSRAAALRRRAYGRPPTRRCCTSAPPLCIVPPACRCRCGALPCKLRFEPCEPAAWLAASSDRESSAGTAHSQQCESSRQQSEAASRDADQPQGVRRLAQRARNGCAMRGLSGDGRADVILICSPLGVLLLAGANSATGLRAAHRPDVGRGPYPRSPRMAAAAPPRGPDAVVDDVVQSCAVCLEPYSLDGAEPPAGQDDHRPRALACGHTLCSLCLHRQLAIRKECPTCRRRIKANSVAGVGVAWAVIDANQALSQMYLDIARLQASQHALEQQIAVAHSGEQSAPRQEEIARMEEEILEQRRDIAQYQIDIAEAQQALQARQQQTEMEVQRLHRLRDRELDRQIKQLERQWEQRIENSRAHSQSKSAQIMQLEQERAALRMQFMESQRRAAAAERACNAARAQHIALGDAFQAAMAEREREDRAAPALNLDKIKWYEKVALGLAFCAGMMHYVRIKHGYEKPSLMTVIVFAAGTAAYSLGTAALQHQDRKKKQIADAARAPHRQ